MNKTNQPKELDVAQVRATFDYNPETGLLTWKVRNSVRIKVGDVAGTLTSAGYIAVSCNGTSYLAHRLIWVLVYGCNPEGDIDHINRIRTDNRLSNLRAVDRSTNLLNAKALRNVTGFSGVMPMPSGKFRAAIHIKRKCTYIGSFPTAEEAHEAYKAEHIKLYGAKSRFYVAKA